jgi:hypothetical protein
MRDQSPLPCRRQRLRCTDVWAMQRSATMSCRRDFFNSCSRRAASSITRRSMRRSSRSWQTERLASLRLCSQMPIPMAMIMSGTVTAAATPAAMIFPRTMSSTMPSPVCDGVQTVMEGVKASFFAAGTHQRASLGLWQATHILTLAADAETFSSPCGSERTWTGWPPNWSRRADRGGGG